MQKALHTQPLFLVTLNVPRFLYHHRHSSQRSMNLPSRCFGK